MADLEQLKKLNELDEKGLREDVLLPLLTRLGCKPPTIYHGPQERGKDIITYTHDLLNTSRSLQRLLTSAGAFPHRKVSAREAKDKWGVV